jgi:tetratricopeptide (TPR) repeat protein
MVKLYRAQGRSREAAQRLTTLVQEHPDNARLHFLLALAYFDSKDLDRSESTLKKAMELDPRTPDEYSLLANIDLARGSIDKAEADLRKAIQASPRNVANYLALARLYQKKGDWQEAKKICEQAHALDPSAPAAAAQLAFLYLDHGGDVNAALSMAQMVKEKMPDSVVATDILGWAYYKLGSPDNALIQLEECAKKAPDNPVFQYHLGMAYLSAGHLPAAQRSLQLALRNDRDFVYAADARSALEKISKSKR